MNHDVILLSFVVCIAFTTLMVGLQAIERRSHIPRPQDNELRKQIAWTLLKGGYKLHPDDLDLLRLTEADLIQLGRSDLIPLLKSFEGNGGEQ